MAELFERLERTGALLSLVIDQYLDTCVAISNYPRLSSAGVSRALFDRVASELPLVTSYETKIKQAKATIGYTMNSSSPVPHINTLPPEILIRIFHIITDTCGLMIGSNVGDSVPLPRYPDYLSHVCTRWRQVALDSPRLWTHIDLVCLSTRNHGFKTRAETFVLRAGSCLFDIHIYEQPKCLTYDRQSMLDLITLTAPRTRSLQLVAHAILGYGRHPRLLAHCVDNYVPGVLTELDITKGFNTGHNPITGTYFINSSDHPGHPSIPPLNVTAECLDALLLPVTHLRLDSIYFPWTHCAYHGLVELRLLSNGEHFASITKLELAGILASSPRLRLLHSEVNISEQAVDSVIAPVTLDELEILQLHLTQDRQPHLSLSLLTPGPKPLRFSFTHNEHINVSGPQQEWLIRIKDFFKRSNITELRLRHFIWPPQVGPEHLLESLPNLRVLVLDNCCDDSDYESSPFPPVNSEPLQLDVVYMVGCTIELGKLAQTFQHIRPQQTVFLSCDFSKNGPVPWFGIGDDDVKEELDLICPSFTWVESNEPSPIDDWD